MMGPGEHIHRLDRFHRIFFPGGQEQQVGHQKNQRGGQGGDHEVPGGKAADDTVREIQKNVAKAASESASAGPGVDLSREIDKISPKDNDSGSPTRQFTPVNARSFSFDDLRYGGKEEGK